MLSESRPTDEKKQEWQPVAHSLKTQLEALDPSPLTKKNTQWLDSIVAIQQKALETVGGENEQQKIAADDILSIWLTLFQTIEITAQSPLYYNIVQAYLVYHSDPDALGNQANTMQGMLQLHLEDKNLKNLNPPCAPKDLSSDRTVLWNMLFFLNASVTTDNQGTITPVYPEEKVVTKFVKALPENQVKRLKNALQLKKPSKRIVFAQLIVNNKTDFLQKATQCANKSDFFSCLFFNSITWGHTDTEAKQGQPTLQWPREQTLGTIEQLDSTLHTLQKDKLIQEINAGKITAQSVINSGYTPIKPPSELDANSSFVQTLFDQLTTLSKQPSADEKQGQPTLQWPSEQTLGTIEQLDKRLTQREKTKLVDNIKKTPGEKKLLTDALTWAQRNDALKKAYGVGAMITCLLGATTLTLDSNPGIFQNKITVDSITEHISTLSPITTACLGLSGLLLGAYLGYRHGKKAGAVACLGAIGLTAIPLLNDIGFANFLPTASALAIAQIGIIVVASVALWAEKGSTPQTHSFN